MNIPKKIFTLFCLGAISLNTVQPIHASVNKNTKRNRSRKIKKKNPNFVKVIGIASAIATLSFLYKYKSGDRTNDESLNPNNKPLHTNETNKPSNPNNKPLHTNETNKPSNPNNKPLHTNKTNEPSNQSQESGSSSQSSAKKQEIVVASDSGSIHLIDLINGRQMQKKYDAIESNHKGFVSPKRNLIAITGEAKDSDTGDSQSTVIVVNLLDFSIKKQLTVKKIVSNLVWINDNEFVLCEDVTGKLRSYKTDDENTTGTELYDAKEEIKQYRISPNGQFIAFTTSTDKKLKIVDKTKTSLLKEIEDVHLDIEFSPDGKFLAFWTGIGALNIYTFTDSNEIKKVNLTSAISDTSNISWSKDNTLAITQKSSILLLDFDQENGTFKKEEIPLHERQNDKSFDSLAWSEDNQKIIFCEDNNVVQLTLNEARKVSGISQYTCQDDDEPEYSNIDYAYVPSTSEWGQHS